MRHEAADVRPIASLTNYLSQMLGSPVTDQTGLTGSFNFALEPSAVPLEPGQGWSDRVP